MQTWLKRIGGTVAVAVAWALGWAFFGLLVGVASLLLPGLPWDAVFKVFDAPLPALAVPGFVGGLLFSMVLLVTERRRTFAQYSLLRFIAWGAAAGLLLSLVPATLTALGLAEIGRAGLGLWSLTAAISVPFMALGALTAATLLGLARRARPLRMLLA